WLGDASRNILPGGVLMAAAVPPVRSRFSWAYVVRVLVVLGMTLSSLTLLMLANLGTGRVRVEGNVDVDLNSNASDSAVSINQTKITLLNIISSSNDNAAFAYDRI